MRADRGGGGVSMPDGQKTVLNYFTVFRGDPIFSRMGGAILPGAGPNAFYRNPYNL